MKIKNRIIYLLFVFIFVISLASCKGSIIITTIIEGDNTITKKELPFYNKSKYCNSKNSHIPTYYFNDSSIPRIAIEDYIHKIDFFNINLSVKKENDEYLYYLENDDNLLIKVLPVINQLIIYNHNFILTGDLNYKTINEIKNVKGEAELLNGTKAHRIYLDDYHQKIETVEGKAVLPFDFVSNLFTYNSNYAATYFGDKYYGFSIYDDFDGKNYKKEVKYGLGDQYMTYNFYVYLYVLEELNGHMIYSGKNALNYTIDYSTLMSNIATTAKGTARALVNLDDPHTLPLTYGYNSNEEIQLEVKPGSRIAKMVEVYNYLNTADERENGSYLNDKTAYFKFDKFMHDGNTSTAKDIYDFLVKCKEDNIENIVFDITLNEGGDTIAMAEILGFMTNEDIEIEITNVITKEKIIENLKIDANYDGDFDDNDAFDNFNYFVLTSDYSFSCANIFSNYCRNKNLATILGQKTGGGACAITRVILPTGVCFQMSGLNGFYNNEYFLPEYGTKPDIELDYKYIYGEKTILSAIDETNNKK